MDEQMAKKQSPKAFISYSWDDDSHKQWVRDFATRLRGDGIDVTLDRWHAVPGDQLPEFMERAVRESDFVLCICTPRYRDKSDRRGGGVGYEGDVMTGEVLVSRTQRKFIPILRISEWKDAAPSWLQGKYYIDLHGNPYSEQNYQDLLTTLHDKREEAPPVSGHTMITVEKGEEDSEFVNREIELATLDPAKLYESYWQYALVSAPTGYGKTRLLKRLVNKIQNDPELSRKWNIRYVDLQNCVDLDNAIPYIAKIIINETITSEMNAGLLKDKIFNYILDEMSKPTDEGLPRNTLIIVDTIDSLTSTTVEWLSSVIHDVVLGSYVDYEKDEYSFAVRFILSGIDTEAFLKSYLKWEASLEGYKLRPPKPLPLSAFNDLAIQDLINRRTKKEGVFITSSIPDISYSLQFLSGGHPQVVSEILDELAVKKFRRYKDYFRENRESLVRNYVSKVAKKILHRFPLPQAEKDIKTICVFRLNDLNTLQKLLSENLVSSQVDINFLGQLCENKILNPPNREKLFYHDDIIRRILYLDLAFGVGKDFEHIQQTHQAAKSLYRSWIEAGLEQHSFHHFFVEWVFHALQITDLTSDAVFSEWKSLLSLIETTSLPANDLKRAIREQLEADNEVKYLYRECFGSDDFSLLFEM